MRAVAVLMLALTLAGAAASATKPSLAKLEGEVMCPVCKTPLDQSASPAATRIKQLIVHWIALGWSEERIKSTLVASYGPAILAEPPKSGFDLLAWLLPIAGILGGAVVLGVLARRWSRAREPAPVLAGLSLDAALDRRVDEELARFEG